MFIVLKSYGMDIYDPNVPSFVLLCLSFLILTVISIGCFINVIFYFFILLNSENEWILKFVNKHWILKRIFNIYLNTSRIFIIVEICLFLYLNFTIIFICFIIVNLFYKII
jgi:hypothetical protein